jgi:hypothetical protein
MKLRSRILAPALAAAFTLALAGFAAAATIVIVNNDGAGEGFNDATPVAPVGGNPGTTRGQQRMNVFVQAANIWGGILPSAVTIEVRSAFNPLTCSATSAVLGSAGPTTVHANFAGAIMTNYWYYQALANRLNGTDLSANQDINAQFNTNIDAGCFGPGFTWYYGFDGLEGPTQIELLPVVLHEMGHGLGFSTQTSGTTGNYLGTLPAQFPTIFDHFLYDDTQALHWDQMVPAQRVASAINTGHLTWDGPNAVPAANAYLGPRQRMQVNSPYSAQYQFGSAAFGPQTFNVTGNCVLVDDGTAPSNSDACEPLVNAGAVAGNIAVLDRGTCSFVIKAQQAQAAGAIAVIVVNNAAGSAPGMAGSDPTIVIPVVSLSQADGTTLKTALLGGPVNVNIGPDPSFKAGETNAGLPLMYAPNPFASGSSVSHWDTSMQPNTLMEPAINNDLHDNVDLTVNVFTDIGWFGFPTATLLSMFDAEGREDGIVLRWSFTDPSDIGSVAIERATSKDGPWAPVGVDWSELRGTYSGVDGSAVAGTTYSYRLDVTDRGGNVSKLGLATAVRTAPGSGTFLARPFPNPASQGTTFAFRLAQPEFVRLSVLDAGGRTVRTLHQGMMEAGAHTGAWDGRSERGEVAAGVYFVRMQTSQGVNTQRIAVVR